MIPAENFRIRSDGQVALWVPTDDEFGDLVLVETIRDENRPCDSCRGRGTRFFDKYGQVWGDGLAAAMGATVAERSCLDCDGTGRHTFEVQYQAQRRPGAQAESVLHPTLRVHVIDVLRIVSMTTASSPESPALPFVLAPVRPGDETVVVGYPDEDHETTITLPPAGIAGRWLARLAIHPGS